MALSSTDPKVLMGQAKCFSCLSPKLQYQLRTYLLALIAMGDTSITGVQTLSTSSTCFSCLTHGELLAAKQYLMAVWLGLDTTKTGIIAQAATAACDYACLTPVQAEQVRTYLLAVTAGVATDAAGVRALELAAKCFECPTNKRQLEMQVYLLSTLAPGAPTTASAIMQAAGCFLACVPPELHEAFQTSLFAQVAGRSTPPCVTPTAPSQPSAFSTLDTILKISWTQPANSGSLIQSYTISYGTTQGGPYTATKTVQAGTKQAILNGLTSGTTYYFVVKANSFTGCSSANSSEGSASTTGTPPIDPAVTAWQARVIANGGASPSAPTLAAADTFWKAIKAAGIDTLIKELNFFAPDSLIAALTPFIVTREANLWTAATSTISNAGLDTNATTTLNTAGLGPNYFTSSNAGMTWYGKVVGLTPDQIQCGTGVGGNDSIFLYPGGGVCYAYPAATATTGATPFAANNFGFMSVNRVANNDLRVFWGNQAIPVVQAGFTANAPGAVPAAPSWNVGNQAGLGGRFQYNFNEHCVHILFAVHLGMTLTQVSALQAATATLRIAFGGSA